LALEEDSRKLVASHFSTDQEDVTPKSAIKLQNIRKPSGRSVSEKGEDEFKAMNEKKIFKFPPSPDPSYRTKVS
jgi:hypothetical protein